MPQSGNVLPQGKLFSFMFRDVRSTKPDGSCGLLLLNAALQYVGLFRIPISRSVSSQAFQQHNPGVRLVFHHRLGYAFILFGKIEFVVAVSLRRHFARFICPLNGVISNIDSKIKLKDAVKIL
jgi:hypothetical protein